MHIRNLRNGGVLVLVALMLSGSLAHATEEATWLPASHDKLPRWRGFNLLEKFQVRGQSPFVEKDFQLIRRLGFNFVRLPMDYRCWIVDGDWEKFNEQSLKEIDQAVEWGRQYNIHVCVNFHRAPGYTVAKPEEKLSLWTDAEAQRVCALHWAAFARRYKGIPNERLSFNLFNEPAKIEAPVYAEVVRKVVAAIRKEDPNRLIISDGLEWGKNPIPELRELRIAQATRGYSPGDLSHYKASWAGGDKHTVVPRWPNPNTLPGTIITPQKKEGGNAIVINGPFVTNTALRLHVQKVSVAAKLVVEADQTPIFEKAFKCGPGDGEWKKVEFSEQFKIYQNIYDRDYTVTIPANTRQVKVHVVEGDWLQIDQVGLKAATESTEAVVNLVSAYGKKADPFRYAPGQSGGPILDISVKDGKWLWETGVQPWKDLEASGVGIFVGEWGCYNKTPHDVVLRWAEDNLANWKKANMGWAMWNLRGSFGILDSGRADVQYEEFEGHKLDRKLLDLLQRY